MTGIDSMTPSEKAARTAKWAVTMAKVKIRQAVREKPYPRWHLVTFDGPKGSESRGVVDMIAIRKNHNTSHGDLKKGDDFQLILIQAKGGTAANPTKKDGERLRIVARLHGAKKVLLASWKKGRATDFFELQTESDPKHDDWSPVEDLSKVFG